MNKKHFLLTIIICLLFTFFITKVYFHSGFPYTHDGENHLARFANYILAIREHQFPPRFAPNLFDHFGYPAFNYNYPLANILSVPLSYAHISYENIFKFLAIVAVFGGLIGTWQWLQEWQSSWWAQLFGIAVFASNPYLLNAIIFRGNIGEIFALCLMPWVFWTVEKLRRSQPSPITIICMIIIYSLFSLSHNIAVVFLLPLLFIYALLRLPRSRQTWFTFFLIVITATLATLWFWLPAIVEKSETVVDSVNVTQQVLDHFPTFDQLFFSPLTFGFSYKGPVDNLSFSLGLVQIAVVVLGTIFLIHTFIRKQFTYRHLALFVLCLMCIGLGVLQLPVTAPLWKLFLPIVKYLQFPWRLSMFWQIFLLPIAAFLFAHLNIKGKLFLLALLAMQLSYVWRVKAVDYFHHTQQDYDYFTQSSSTNNENRTKNFTYMPTRKWEASPDIIGGTSGVGVVNWRGSEREYELVLSTPSTIIEPTMNFLGWETYVNGKRVNYIDSTQIGGRIAYQLSPGKYSVQTLFTQNTPARRIGNTTSAITIIMIGCAAIYALLSKRVQSMR